MTAAEVGFAALSRAVVAAAADLVADVERRVVGDANVRTAQGNAWAAMCADRARAQARADVDALVAALAARPRGPQGPPRGPQAARHSEPTGGTQTGGSTTDTTRGGNGGKRAGGAEPARGQRAVGSSPRSSASQAALVSTR
ncbi:hypothetical protein [Actinoplanes sp. NPDC049118]|uniref:hypothetical protein n=1 Tax=Actinoplanes sp. NPDC049118 TaxID=3155769 RepID=UPI0033C4921C